MTRRLPPTIFVALGALSLFACGRQEEGPSNETTVKMAGNEAAGFPRNFKLGGANGAALGNVSVSDQAGGMSVAVDARGIPAGIHGIHLHEKGLCDGPSFQSAGGHWNPGKKNHGRDNPQGAHLGDLANFEVAADGTATAAFELAGASMAGGNMRFADTDGTALVIHAKPDDYKTDPSGASGDRIACAVLAAPK
ncbi:MAG: superoxide dismutase family protein [Pseudomonadota bacterium]|nr:superoxide dismutase family protein [Pseudomonadota bacterium]